MAVDNAEGEEVECVTAMGRSGVRKRDGELGLMTNVDGEGSCHDGEATTKDMRCRFSSEKIIVWL